jgi:hypothetical protein
MPEKRIDEFDEQTLMAPTDLMWSGNPSTGKLRKITQANFFASMPDLTPADVASALPYVVSAATGDGTTDDTTILQAELDAAGVLAATASISDKVAEVHLVPSKWYRAVGLSVPDHVALRCNGAKLQANGAGTLVTLAGLYSQISDGALWGINPTTTTDEAVHMHSSGGWQRVERCSFDAFGGSAILCEAGASWIADNLAFGCVTNAAALAVPTGVLHIDAHDCWIQNGEYNASKQAGMSASGNAYAVVLHGGTHMLTSVIGEISDHGFYVNSTETRLTACRADLNRGHGFVLAGSSTGSLVGCLALRNSNQTTNTYDGFNFANGTNWQVDGCRASSLGADAWAHRWGFNDATSGASNNNRFGPTNRSTVHATGAISVSDSSGSHVTCDEGPFVGIPAAATTYNLQTYGWPATRLYFQNVGAVSFTNWTNGVTGQLLIVKGDGQTTFVHDGVNIRTKTAANTLAAANTYYQFIRAGSVWEQVV